MPDEWKQIRPLPPPPPSNVDMFSKDGYMFRIFIHPPDKSGDLQISMMALIDIMKNKANLQLIDGPSGDNNSGNFIMKNNITGTMVFNILCFNSMKTKIYVLSVASPYQDYSGKTELNNIIKTFKWIE